MSDESGAVVGRPSQSRRRFLISDAMVLIAATAVGIALARMIMSFEGWRRDFGTPQEPWRTARVVFRNSRNVGSPLLLTWTVALLVLHLRRPRPRLRRVFRRPGAIACGVATLAFLLPTVLIIPLGVRARAEGSSVGDPFYLASIWVLGANGGLGVLCGWLTLVLGGRWRPEPSWLDRAGRIVGAGWIAAYVLRLCMPYLR
jgi:hypothetical protein